MTKIEGDFTSSCKIYFEHNLAIGNSTYLVIYGEHINGGFICIPNWKWSCEASGFRNSAEYNAEKLVACGAPEKVAIEIAKHIDKWLDENI